MFGTYVSKHVPVAIESIVAIFAFVRTQIEVRINVFPQCLLVVKSLAAILTFETLVRVR